MVWIAARERASQRCREPISAPSTSSRCSIVFSSIGASRRQDNGPEFAGRLLDQWAYLNGVELDLSRPGPPTDNAFIDAFNARIRAECLNASWFFSHAAHSTF